MALQGPNHRNPLYPEVMESNPNASSKPNSSSNLYPSIDMRNLVENLFPDNDNLHNPNSSHPTAPPVAIEEVLITIPGAILNLIDNHYSVELACGDLTVVRIRQGDNVVAVLARVADEIQWPLAKDEAAVKLDDSHYFFSLRTPKEHRSGSDSSDEEDEPTDSDDLLNYGLTIASKGQENLVKGLDGILQSYSSFSVQKVSANANIKKGEALDGSVAREVSPAELKSEKKKELMEKRCAAYWTTLAPNVEDYSGTAARLITAGSGKLIKGILWCGDVTVDRLKVGNEVMKKRINPRSSSEIDPKTLKRIKGKVCDAVEIAGKNVMSTSSTVTTELVTHRYGEQAGEATSEGLDAAGHAIGAGWAAFKIRKAFNPKSVLKPTTLAKSAAKAAAAEKKKAKKSK